MRILKSVMFLVAALFLAALLLDFGIIGGPRDPDQPRFSYIGDAADIVVTIADDMWRICERRPEVCEKTSRIFSRVKGEAASTLKGLYGWLDDGGAEEVRNFAESTLEDGARELERLEREDAERLRRYAAGLNE